MRAEVDPGEMSMGKAIRQAVTRKIPNVLVIGEREVADEQVTLRRYGVSEQETMPAEEFRARLRAAIAGRTTAL